MLKIFRLHVFYLVVICFSGEVLAVSIFSNNVMCSKVSGAVFLNGVPVENAEIERYYRWGWDDKKEVDKTNTDKNGGFELPLLEKSPGMSRLVPHEPVIFQQITINYKGETFIAWQHTKHNYDENGELKGSPLVFSCELSKKPEEHDGYVGICTINK